MTPRSTRAIAIFAFLGLLFVVGEAVVAHVDRPRDKPYTYRVGGSFIAGHLTFIEEELKRIGFSRNDNVSDWDLLWAVWLKPEQFFELQHWQKIGNLPNIVHLTHKDRLHRGVTEMQNRYGKADFMWWPDGYNLEQESEWNTFRQHFVDYEAKHGDERKLYEMHKQRRAVLEQLIQETSNKTALDVYNADLAKSRQQLRNLTNLRSRHPPPVFIIKLPSVNRGMGVQLVGSLAEVDAMKETGSMYHPINEKKPLAQKYLTNVLTLGGYKVTLRVYVAVTSLDPMRLYVFDNGLVRMCSHKYSNDPDNLRDKYAHFDSIDINHVNEEIFEHEVSHVEFPVHREGLRVEIKDLLQYLGSQGHNATKIWKDVQHAVLMSFLSGEHALFAAVEELCIRNRQHRLSPYEVLGYDILLDTHMKPWVIEINNAPSMVPGTNLENVIKRNLLSQSFFLNDIKTEYFGMIQRMADEKWNIIQTMPRNTQLKKDGKTFDLWDITSRDDVAALVETELEYERRGNFERIAPVAGGDHYLNYVFNKRRNKLMVDWLNSGMKIEDLHHP